MFKISNGANSVRRTKIVYEPKSGDGYKIYASVSSYDYMLNC